MGSALCLKTLRTASRPPLLGVSPPSLSRQSTRRRGAPPHPPRGPKVSASKALQTSAQRHGVYHRSPEMTPVLGALKIKMTRVDRILVKGTVALPRPPLLP